MKTKVILVPSHKDIHHFEPLPQAPFAQNFIPTSVFPSFLSVSNPCLVQMNELKVGLVNTDIIKDLCSSMYPKNMEPPKIDLSLKALLEQRSFYPLFPGNSDVPIEYEQIEKLFITEQPDLLITSSDLIQFVKTIEGVVCINPGAIFKNDQAGTYCTLTIEPFDYKAYVSTDEH